MADTLANLISFVMKPTDERMLQILSLRVSRLSSAQDAAELLKLDGVEESLSKSDAHLAYIMKDEASDNACHKVSITENMVSKRKSVANAKNNVPTHRHNAAPAHFVPTYATPEFYTGIKLAAGGDISMYDAIL